MLRAATLAVLLSCAAGAAGITPHAQIRRQLLRGAHNVRRLGEAVDAPPTQWLTQPLNHSNPAQGTFRQRYWTRSEWWCGNSSCPVLLCTGGEGPGNMDLALTNQSVHCGIMLSIAPRLGALLVALEHRFYGESLPGAGRTLQSLRFLDSAQNVADLPALHEAIGKQFPGAGSAKWVSFGGSYPGMMASFFRVKHPELIHAAIASSAPVEAQFDFKGYLGVVAADLADPLIGGSAQCLSIVRDGHASVAADLGSAEGQARVAKDFALCNASALADPGNRADFAGIGVFPFNWQGNDPACTGALCSVAKICSFLTAEAGPADPRARIAALTAALLKQYGEKCVSVDHDGGNAQMRKWLAAADRTDDSWALSWTWQTCNEWGFFQSCEVGSECPFAQGSAPVEVVADACPKVFGVPFDQVRRNIAASNARFGGVHPKATRIFYVNGGEDPWHALSVQPPGTADLPAYLAPGVSHHFWTHPARPTDTQADVAAREAVVSRVSEWLALP